MLKVNELQRKRQTFLSSFYQNEDALYINAINATVVRNFPQAVNFYQKISEHKPAEPHVYLDLGRAYEKNEETDKAIESYRKAISLNGQYGAGFLRLGILLRRKAEYDNSNEAFDRAENIYDRLSNDEGVAEVKYQRGVSLSFQEKTDAARNQFEQVIGNPRANKYQKIRAMLQISSVCSGLGKTPCAEEYASNAINLAKQERMENLTSKGLIYLGNAFLARAE
jgi:tetratricopeptide (TPR) repeat protein